MHYDVVKYSMVDDEIEMAILYYESVSYQLGVRFEREIENALDKLETDAAYYFNLEDKIHRRIPLDGFPYSFIYSVEKGNQVIVKILFPQKEGPAKLWVQLANF